MINNYKFIQARVLYADISPDKYFTQMEDIAGIISSD